MEHIIYKGNFSNGLWNVLKATVKLMEDRMVQRGKWRVKTGSKYYTCLMTTVVSIKQIELIKPNVLCKCYKDSRDFFKTTVV